MGGGGDRGAREQAERSYEIQREQLELQKRQLAEAEEKEKSKERYRQQALEELTRRKKVGRKATLLTDWESLGTPEVSRASLYA